MQSHRQLRLIILVAIGILFLNNWRLTPAPQLEPMSISESTASIQDRLTQRKLWVAREATAYALYQASRAKMPSKRARLVAESVIKESSHYQVDPLTVLGLIIVESNGETRALSSAGARGLMQIMPETGQFISDYLPGKWEGNRALYELGTNVRYGTWYLKHLQRTFPGNEQAVLAAYNWGPGYVQQVLDRGQALPRVYPAKVRRARERIRKEMYEYHQTQYWRAIDLDRDPPHFEDYAAEPIRTARSRDFLVSNGEG